MGTNGSSPRGEESSRLTAVTRLATPLITLTAALCMVACPCQESSKMVRNKPAIATFSLYALLLLVLLGGCGASGTSGTLDLTGTWKVTQNNPDGTVFAGTVTLQQTGTNLTGTVTAAVGLLSLTGNINVMHVHLVNDHTLNGLTCESVWELDLSDSTHMQGGVAEFGACGNDFRSVNVTLVKQ